MSKSANNKIPESIKYYKIEKEAFKLSNSTLYSAINKDINEKVLIHIFPKEEIKEKANEVTFMNNHVYLLKLVNHKNILKLYEIIETKTHAFLIYEYFDGIKLSDFISKKKKLSEEESMFIFKEILSILVYLHDMYLCNLNINSNNILIDTKNNIKLCDFKYGHFYSNKEKSRTGLIGDHSTACPELHSKKPYNPELADIWSMGVVLYQMVTGELPFKSHKDLDLIRLIIKGDYSLPKNLSGSMKNLIKGILEVKEDKRIKLNDLFEQQLLKDKKITKSSLSQGLNVLVNKYPIDGIVLNICKNNFGIDVATLIKSLENNKFTPITSLFHQIVTKLSKKGIQTINDLSSSKFINYLNDSKNCLKEEEQINNIQNYLKKEEEIKKNSQDISAILLNNQNEISKGLDDLKHQFEDSKKGVKPMKRNKSFGQEKNKRRKTFQLDNNKDIMRNLNKLNNAANNINNNNVKDNNTSAKKKNANNVNNILPVKRNTICFPNLSGFGLNKKGNKKNNVGKKNVGKTGGGKQVRKFGNFNKNDNKFKKGTHKVIEEIKEEDEYKEKEEHKEKEKIKDKDNNNSELNKSNSEKSIGSKESSNSKTEDKKEEKKEEKEEEKKEEIKKEEKKEEIKKEEKKPEIQKEIKKEEKKVENKKVANPSNKMIKPDGKPSNQINSIKLNKVPITNVAEQKPKKILQNNQQNDMNAINKKLENNDKKVKLNLKKEEIEREMNIMKIKNELKKGGNQKSSFEIGKNANNTKKNEPPKVAGFKNIKEMIEQNIKKQRVNSTGVLRPEKKKPGK